jgi:hypothetical protein
MNDSTVEKLRGSFAARDETRTARGECPDAERIWDAANGTLDPEETHRVVDHFTLCPSCAADWRLAMPAGASAGAEVVEFRPRRRVAQWVGLAAAAAVLAFAFVGWYQWVAPVQTEPVYRATDAVIRSLVAEETALPRESAVVRWTSAGEDALYSVEVGKTDLTPLASAHDLKQTEFVIPPEALEELETGGTVVWQVEALLPDGRRIVSEAFVNRVE